MNYGRFVNRLQKGLQSSVICLTQVSGNCLDNSSLCGRQLPINTSFTQSPYLLRRGLEKKSPILENSRNTKNRQVTNFEIRCFVHTHKFNSIFRLYEMQKKGPLCLFLALISRSHDRVDAMRTSNYKFPQSLHKYKRMSLCESIKTFGNVKNRRDKKGDLFE